MAMPKITVLILSRAAAFAVPVWIFFAVTTFLYVRQLQESINDPALVEYVRWRWATNGALGFAGAAAGYVVTRAYLPSIRAALVAGLVFGVTSHFVTASISAVFFRLQIPNIATAWWIVGAALFAYAGAVASSANRLPTTTVNDVGGFPRFVGLPLLCALATLVLAPVLWSLWVRQFHPLMFLLAMPYAITGGLIFGLMAGAIPSRILVAIRDSSWWKRIAFFLVPGILAGVTGSIVASLLMEWRRWGDTAAFVRTKLKLGLLVSNEVVFVCFVLGMVCGPILWGVVRRVRQPTAT